MKYLFTSESHKLLRLAITKHRRVIIHNTKALRAALSEMARLEAAELHEVFATLEDIVDLTTRTDSNVSSIAATHSIFSTKFATSKLDHAPLIR